MAVHINIENFSDFTDIITKYTLQSINNLNEYFDADEVFEILTLITKGLNEKRSRDTINVLRTTVHKYLSMDGIVVDDDTDLPFILNVCAQYLKHKIQ